MVESLSTAAVLTGENGGGGDQPDGDANIEVAALGEPFNDGHSTCGGPLTTKRLPATGSTIVSSSHPLVAAAASLSARTDEAVDNPAGIGH